MLLLSLKRVVLRANSWTLVVLQIGLLFLPSIAQANPLAPSVVAGSATINQAGNTTTIHQATNRAIINWQGFSISSGEVTQFIQPGSSSAILNRVTGGDPSAILGSLQSNGRVFLINPNGIVFGQGAQINVGGLVASTLDINNAEFMRGGDLNFQGNSTASVINRGQIRALEGDIFLIGARVENHGLLQASHGTVGLAAGQDVRLVDSGHKHLVVRPNANSLGGTGVLNTGTINAVQAELTANGGNVYALAINNQGTVRATGSVVENGRVLLKASGGKVENSGDLIAKNADDTGGEVQVLGNEVRLAGGTIDVSGANGGGVALVGGDYQGSNPTIANAQTVYVDANATINADATLLGDGGKVIVWSDDTTTFAGNITARGGALGGNGGFAEVSGKLTLNYTGLANLSAPLGTTGTLLLDPTDFTIGATEATTITTNLATANVVVATNAAGVQDGDVTISSAIKYSSANDFAILAHGDIIVDQSIQNDGTGAVSLVAGWDGTTEAPGSSGINSPAAFNINNIFADANSYGNNDHSVFIGDGTQTAGVAVGSRFGATNVAAHDLTLQGSDNMSMLAISGYAQLGFRADSTLMNFDIDGTIDVTLTGDLTAMGGSKSNTYVQVGHGGSDFYQLVEPDGNFQGAITIHQVDDLTFSGGSHSSVYAQLGHGGYSADGDFDGAITITQANNLTFNGGSSSTTYAHLGHGGYSADGEFRGAISVTVANDLIFTAGGGSSAYVQLGHGGDVADGDRSGAISVTAGNDLIFTGNGSYAPAQLGHGGYSNAGEFSGAITVIAGNNLIFTGGGRSAYVQLGHGGDLASGIRSGAISVSAGYDLTFTAGGSNAPATLGHGGYNNDGKHSGDITITAGHDLTFTGSGNTAYAQLGHGGIYANGERTGNITIISANNLNFTGGSGSKAYAQLGHGGYEAEGDHSGDITIASVNDLNLKGGSATFAYVQIGHGDAPGTESGTRMGHIDIRVTGETSLVNNNSNWLIGHATNTAGGISNANVTLITGTLDYDNIAASALFNISGTDGDDFATKMIANLEGGHVTLGATNGLQGGMGGMSVASPFIYDSANNLSFLSTTDIRFDASVQNGSLLNTGTDPTGEVNVVAGWDGTTGVASPLVIGDIFGDVSSFGTNNGSVFIGDQDQLTGIAVGSRFGATNVAAHDLTLQGSNTENMGFAQLGFRTDSNQMNFDINGTIDVALTGNLNASGGNVLFAYAQVGHGGFDFNDSTNDIDGNYQGAITIHQAGDLNFSGGGSRHPYAQLGHGGAYSNGTHSGDITITQANDLNFSGGNGGFNLAYSQLGHGGLSSDGDRSGAITITRANDLNFSGGNGSGRQFAYAQLGHGGIGAEGNHSGAITIHQANDLNLISGTGSSSLAYAQLGHGDASGSSLGDRTDDIRVILNGSATLTSNSANKPALLGHATSTLGGIDGNLTLAIDQADPLVDGGGSLTLDAFSLIDMGGAPNQVRIFDTRQLGSNFADGSVINGIVTDGSLAPGTRVGDRWNPNIEFFSWDHEQWGVAGLGQYTLAVPGPYTSPFTFYYLSILDIVPGLRQAYNDATNPYDNFERYELWAQTFGAMFPQGPYSSNYGPDDDRPMGELSGNSSASVFGGE